MQVARVPDIMAVSADLTGGRGLMSEAPSALRDRPTKWTGMEFKAAWTSNGASGSLKS